ncbi:hypothetical protein [Infirmifilum sp. NZ]|nr:hypothetical protein [Infirmifilum sp. NZ]UNQ74272.1 hypothetical protein MOV14_04505 [Infirmifilum sp. NZ]
MRDAQNTEEVRLGVLRAGEGLGGEVSAMAAGAFFNLLLVTSTVEYFE